MSLHSNNQYVRFKNRMSQRDRTIESKRILDKYPERIPVICEISTHERELAYIDKNKYLVPKSLTVGQLMYVVRKRLKLSPSDALFLFFGNDSKIYTLKELISTIYKNEKDKDGFLYVVYGKESTFG